MKKTSVPGSTIQQFLKNRLAVAGGVLVVGMLVVAVLGPLLYPPDPTAIDVKNILNGPSLSHPLGTDELGRDVLARMIGGAWISLLVGFVAVGIATIIGVVMGSIAGYFGRIVDTVIMRAVDIMLAVPTIFLILAIVTILKPSIWIIMAVIGFTTWMEPTRLVRAEFMALKEREFVVAERALGASDMRIIFRHILPNGISPIYVSATLGIGAAILVESGLSFLGLGIQPPTPSWGSLLASGRENIEIAWWLSVFPGLAILVTVLGYNLLGEGIRDALDPRIRGTNG